jgi:hypothetical protein
MQRGKKLKVKVKPKHFIANGENMTLRIPVEQCWIYKISAECLLFSE